jgi:thermitase
MNELAGSFRRRPGPPAPLEEYARLRREREREAERAISSNPPPGPASGPGRFCPHKLARGRFRHDGSVDAVLASPPCPNTIDHLVGRRLLGRKFLDRSSEKPEDERQWGRLALHPLFNWRRPGTAWRQAEGKPAMKYTFKLRGKAVTLASIDSVTAVRPTDDVRAELPRGKLTAHFGAPPPDDTRGGSAGLVLPARNRKLFESAGWVFVEARPPVARAAVTRATVEGAQAVRRVYLGRGGTLIGTDRVTVQLDSDMPAADAKVRLKADGLSLVRRLGFAPNTYEARISAKRPELEVVQELQEKQGHYRFVEPVLLEAIPSRYTPSDPDFGNQWQHLNDGSNGGVAGADIKSEAAWDLARGRGVRLAVIDNGIQVTHPDLKAGLVGGGHFVSDGTGGATFQRWQPGQAGFPNGDHGTFCLGMAGARMDNNLGGCGSAPEADLLAIACLTDQVGTQLTLARAIAYAANPTTEDAQAAAADGAHVISCSLGPNGADWVMTSVLELAITAAAVQGRRGLGVPILWAASNGPYDVAQDEVCSHPDVMAVSRSNRNDLEDGAAYGPKLEFLAPGTEVYSTKFRSRYGYATGCSFAAPLAAGVAALVLERYPAWARDQVRQRLRDACDKVGGVTYDAHGRHDEYGYGRLNAEKAVQ